MQEDNNLANQVNISEGKKIANLNELLRNSPDGHKQVKIAIFSHTFPDADALGSALALKNLIQDNFTNAYADVFISTDIDSLYSLILRDEVVNPTVVCEKYDYAFILDSPNVSRIGEYGLELLERVNQNNIINIDHHATNENFGAYNLVYPQCSSTCEILYFLASQKYHWNISDRAAKELFQGIITDTNLLQAYPLHWRTFKAVYELSHSYKFDYQSIMTYYATHSFQKSRLNYKTLATQKLYAGGKLITMEIPNETIKRMNIKREETMGIVDLGLKVAGTTVSALFIEEEPNNVYVSIRGKGDVSVGEIATNFGGGGGLNQAAYQKAGTLKDIKQEFIDYLLPTLESVEQSDDLRF